MSSNNTTQFSANQTFATKATDCVHFFVDSFAYNTSIPEYYVAVIKCFIVLNAFLTVPATFGNAFTFLLIWKTTSLQNPSNVLISLLACSDFFVGTVVQPSFIVASAALLRKQIAKHCVTLLVSDVFAWIFGSASFLTLTLISLDKYIALYYSLRYKNIVTTKRVICAVAVSWALCAIFAPFILVYIRSIKFAVIFVLPIFFFLIGVNTWCYYKIMRVVRQHQVQIHSQASVLNHATLHEETVFPEQNSWKMSRYMKSLKTAFYIAGAFVLCYVPLASFLSLLQFAPKSAFSKHTISSLLIVAETVVFVNSSLNPVIYFWRVTNLRLAAIHQLRKIVACSGVQSDTAQTLQILQFN